VAVVVRAICSFFPQTLALIHSFMLSNHLLSSDILVVDLFFVISGYVLSYRMLKLMRSRQTAPLLDSLASAVFRRYLRLYGSAGVVTFISMVLIRLRWVDLTHRTETLFSQLNDWAKDLCHFSNPFAELQGWWFPGVLSSRYLDPLWTIPVEYRGSVVLYLFCIAACKLSTRNRMLLSLLLISCCYIWAVVYPALFLGGLFLADLSFTRHPERLSSTPILAQNTSDTTRALRKQPLRERIFYSCVLAASLFLLGQPSDDLSKASWPWPQLNKYIPTQYDGSGVKEHFWLSIGSLMLIWSLDSYSALQTPLKWNFSQYLGQISFGIYAMHTLVISSLWRLVLDPWRARLMGEGMWTYVPCLLIFYGVVLWAAELFTKLDSRVVNFGRWLEGRLFEK
jgi:peptidoglycan/LPS O-acetylase OafA/YrhL